MAAEPHSFKRVVLGLQPQTPDRMMRLAVELADLLELELLGLFLEETGLHDLANIPFAREFRPLGGGWHPIDIDDLLHDMEIAARIGERMFAEATKGLAARSRFAVVRGSTPETIASISQTTDIVMIVEPASPADRVTQQFSWLVDAAFRSAGAVMIVPSHIARASGPVAAIAAAPDDPCIGTAAAIAIAANEELVVVAPYESASDDLPIRKLAASAPLKIKHITAGNMPPSDPAAFSHELNELKERLMVMTRDIHRHGIALGLASARHVPILVIEPLELTHANAAPRQQKPS
ncbi:MAG TPA: hypothetical protein VLZ74_15025 [Methylocella sp.]|nr:hypothetical protein [Methylocella sp.]